MLVALLTMLGVSRLTAGERAALNSVADLADTRIAMFLGSAHDRYASRHDPKATLLPHRVAADIALPVCSGKGDAVRFDHPTFALQAFVLPNVLGRHLICGLTREVQRGSREGRPRLVARFGALASAASAL